MLGSISFFLVYAGQSIKSEWGLRCNLIPFFNRLMVIKMKAMKLSYRSFYFLNKTEENILKDKR